MARWTGTWLTGLASAGVDTRRHGWRGRRLGMPPEGVGAIATTGSRVAAFFVDVVVGTLIGALINGFVQDPDPLVRSLAGNGAFAVQVLLLTALTGQSLGMKLIGIRVVRLSRPDAAPGFLPAAVRPALLMLILPALIFDRDGRGLHDKAAGTAVVRDRAERSFAELD